MKPALLIAGALICTSLPLQAATFVVNEIGDDPDANPGDGICDVATGGAVQCTLRAAIMEANTTHAADIVEFSIDLVTIDISGTPLPAITEPLTIDATTTPSYNAAATSTLDAPPSVYINGSALTGPALEDADGLRSNSTFDVVVKGLGIINFPDNGIELYGAGPSLVDSNWIGVERSGGVAGNKGSGIFLNFISQAIVGRDSGFFPGVTRGNVISSNGEHGVDSFNASDAVIGGNFIGVDPIGSADFGNGGDGVRTDGRTLIGGFHNGVDFGNRIENNNGAGIYTQSGGNEIYSNHVAFNKNGGIRLNGYNALGFETEERGNTVVDNIGPGVTLGNEVGGLNSVVHFLTSVGNTGQGLWIIDGQASEIRNSSFAGNGDDALRINGPNTIVTDNEFGLVDGQAVGNAASGIVLASDSNLIGMNTIGAITGAGVDVISGDWNQIYDNFIGVRQNDTDVGVGSTGVRVRAAATETGIIGNRLGFNSEGILLEGSGTQVCGNMIGVGGSGANIANKLDGVRVEGSGNVIGDDSADCNGNRIGFNASDGIQVTGDANTIRDNIIGGESLLNQGNGLSGVFLAAGADLNLIENNSLHHNGTNGIGVAADAGSGNRFDANNFGENGNLGIDLADDGPTANDPGDADSGTNNLQNYPAITNVASVGDQLQITYRVDSTLTNASYPLTVDFYILANPQRHVYRIHRDTYDQSPNTTKTILIAPPRPVSMLSALVIDSEGNTSELSPAQPYTVNAIFSDRFAATP